MPGFLLHVMATAKCPHTSGQIAIITKNTRVFVSNQAVVTSGDNLKIAGCLFQVPAPPGTKPQPCITVEFVPATRVFVNGDPVILVSQGPSPGICRSAEQIPQGPPIVDTVQARVTGV